MYSLTRRTRTSVDSHSMPKGLVFITSPAPIPSTARPPVRLSSVATVLAVFAGCILCVSVTPEPSMTLLVFAPM